MHKPGFLETHSTKRLLLSASLVFGLFLSLGPQPVFAHAGAGPPFLRINGKYCPTNPYFLGSDQVPVSQDLAPDGTYLVNVPIQFEIDLSQLQVPPDVAKNSTFRWSWDTNSQAYQYGTKLSHTYTKVGSTLLTLDVKAPGETDYLTIDTVQMNIVPLSGYKLPTATIEMYPSSLVTNTPLRFRAVTTTDTHATGATTDWYADTDVIKAKPEITRTYTDADFADYIFLKTTDSNNISTDSAIQVAADQGKLEISDLNPLHAEVNVVGQAGTAGKSAAKAPTHGNQLLIGAAIAGIIGIMGAGLYLLKRKKT